MSKLDIKNFQSITGIGDGDRVLLVTAAGGDGKISILLFKNALIADITPIIDSETNEWIVNGVNMGVVARGLPPLFRKGALGIEYRYVDSEQWHLLVEYDAITLRFADLTQAQKLEIKGAKGDTGAIEWNNPTPEQIEMLRGPAGLDLSEEVAQITDLFKPGATLTEVKSELLKLGEEYKDVHSIASKLKDVAENSGGVETITVNNIAERDALNVLVGTFCTVGAPRHKSPGYNETVFGSFYIDTTNEPTFSASPEWYMDWGDQHCELYSMRDQSNYYKVLSYLPISYFNPSIEGVCLIMVVITVDNSPFFEAVWSEKEFDSVPTAENKEAAFSATQGWNKTVFPLDELYIYRNGEENSSGSGAWNNMSVYYIDYSLVKEYIKTELGWSPIDTDKRVKDNIVHPIKDCNDVYEDGVFNCIDGTLNLPSAVRQYSSELSQLALISIVIPNGNNFLKERTQLLMGQKGDYENKTAIYIRATVGCCCSSNNGYGTSWSEWERILTDKSITSPYVSIPQLNIKGAISATAFNTVTAQRSMRSVGSAAAGFETAPKITPLVLDNDILDMTACCVENTDGCKCVEFDLAKIQKHFPDCVVEECECEEHHEITHSEGCKSKDKPLVKNAEPKEKEKKILINERSLNTQILAALMAEVKTLKEEIKILKA